MPEDTSNSNQATAIVATLALRKALGAIRSIPGMSPRYAVQGWQSASDSVAEYDRPERDFRGSAIRGDLRNLETFGESTWVRARSATSPLNATAGEILEFLPR